MYLHMCERIQQIRKVVKRLCYMHKHYESFFLSFVQNFTDGSEKNSVKICAKKIEA
jgi:hypothetical protein